MRRGSGNQRLERVKGMVWVQRYHVFGVRDVVFFIPSYKRRSIGSLPNTSEGVLGEKTVTKKNGDVLRARPNNEAPG